MGKVGLIYLMLIGSIAFWLPASLPSAQNLGALLFLVVGGWIFFRYPPAETRFDHGLGFSVFYLGLIGSAVSCNFYWGQAIPQSMGRVLQYEMFFGGTYFLLQRLQPNPEDLERVLLRLALATAGIFAFQQVMGTNLVFGNISDDVRGTAVRLRVPGSLLFTVFSLYSFNRILTQGRRIHYFMFPFFVVFVFMQGFRVFLVALGSCLLLMALRLMRFDFQTIRKFLMAGVLVIGAALSPIGQGVIDSMLETTTGQIESNSDRDDVRLQALDFYLYSDPLQPAQYVLGSGFPGIGSKYTNRYVGIEENWGLFRADLGLLGYYLMAGAITIAGLGIVIWKALRTPISQQDMYLKFVFVFLLMVSFTSAELFRVGSFGLEGALLYLIGKSKRSEPEISIA